MAKTQNILTFSSNIPWQRKLSTQCLKLIFISSEKFCFIYFNFFSCWRTVQPASDLWLPLYPAIPAAQSSSAQVNMSASFVISLLSDVTYQCHLSSVALYGDWTVSFKPLALCPAIWWGQSPSAQVNMSVLICHQSSVSWRMSVSSVICRTICTELWLPLYPAITAATVVFCSGNIFSFLICQWQTVSCCLSLAVYPLSFHLLYRQDNRSCSYKYVFVICRRYLICYNAHVHSLLQPGTATVDVCLDTSVRCYLSSISVRCHTTVVQLRLICPLTHYITYFR